MEKEKDDEYVSAAMQIILKAGDARTTCTDALTAAKTGDFAKADEMMKTADGQILEAHKSQTGIIQSVMSGKEYRYSLLFSHAQDTLMTIMSEVRLSKEIIDVLRIVYGKKNEEA